jgi:hypothetical protein
MPRADVFLRMASQSGLPPEEEEEDEEPLLLEEDMVMAG